MIPTCIHYTSHIPLSLPPAEWQEGLDFSSNKQSTLLNGPEERLDAISISDGNEELLGVIEKHTGELATQIMDVIQAIVAIKSNDELAITMRAKLIVGLGEEVCADVVVIVKLAIDDSMNSVVCRMKRLGSVRGEVIDGEADMSESCSG